jgi:hypothetical protein
VEVRSYNPRRALGRSTSISACAHEPGARSHYVDASPAWILRHLETASFASFWLETEDPALAHLGDERSRLLRHSAGPRAAGGVRATNNVF